MWWPSTKDLATGFGAVAAAGTVTVLQSDGPAELLFYSVLFAVLAYLGRLTARALRTTSGLRVRASELAGVSPADAALAAVLEERRRLTTDIADSLRDAMIRVLAEATEATVGPGVDRPLRRIRETVQEAASELRRHLGLLRSPSNGDVAPRPEPTSAGLPRRDLLLAVCMTVLATVESIAYPITEPMPSWSLGSVLTTPLAAATVVGRTVALGPATIASAVAFAVGTLVGAPVVEGFWVLGSSAVLVWSVAARSRSTVVEIGGLLMMVVAVVVTRQIDSPDNVGIASMILALAAAAGLLVRMIRARGVSASRRAAALEHGLRSASSTAVGAERIVFARELHDVVSHAIGVIALQAAAAEVSWRATPEAARNSLGVIRGTAESTLAELDALRPGAADPWTLDDIVALVARIEAAGTPVDLSIHGVIPHASLHTIHRVVQEALTNVVRHAPQARVTVRVHTDEAGTTVAIIDDGPSDDADLQRGYGLIGLAERVAFAGGTLDTGRGPGGSGFAVRVALPVPPRTVSS